MSAITRIYRAFGAMGQPEDTVNSLPGLLSFSSLSSTPRSLDWSCTFILSLLLIRHTELLKHMKCWRMLASRHPSREADTGQGGFVHFSVCHHVTTTFASLCLWPKTVQLRHNWRCSLEKDKIQMISFDVHVWKKKTFLLPKVMTETLLNGKRNWILQLDANLRRLFCAFAAVVPCWFCLSNMDCSLRHWNREKKREVVVCDLLLSKNKKLMRAELKHSRWFVFVLTPQEDPPRFHRQHQMASDPLEFIFFSKDIERDY